MCVGGGECVCVRCGLPVGVCGREEWEEWEEEGCVCRRWCVCGWWYVCGKGRVGGGAGQGKAG